MTFQFRPCANPEIAGVAYELPAMPVGISHSLRIMIGAYADAVRDGTDDSEDEPYSVVAAFTARSLSDAIAKLLIQLHYKHRGLDGEQLVLALTKAEEPAVVEAQALLADLSAQLPQDWGSALRAYRSALLAEHDYDRHVWMPGYEAEQQGGRENSTAVEREMESLQDARCAAEDFLLDMPAPSLSEFAIKYLICFDNDRDLNGHHEALCAEAKRLLEITADPHASELASTLTNISWRA